MQLSKLKLIEPTLEFKHFFNEYIEEWKKDGLPFTPSSPNPLNTTYEGWLERLKQYKNAKTCPSDLVPADTFFMTDENEKILGMINIRYKLNDYLKNYGGNIGYGIRPSERRKGYAKKMLKLGLEKCREEGVKKVLITCNKDNAASAKTIMACGGIFEKEIEENGKIKQRYWIEL